jgi:hypothetical protein
VVGGTLLALLVVPALYTVVGKRLRLQTQSEPT